MHNDPELSGKFLGTISADFIKVADALREASYQIRKGGFERPIFPICREPQPIGQLLFDPERNGTSWYYYASFMGEFLQRDLIASDKEADFTEAFKDPDEFCCLFVIDPTFTRFVFIPYPED